MSSATNSICLNELGAFPGVQFRDDDARGAAVIARDRFAVELGGDEDVVVTDIVVADVGGVAVVAGEKDVPHFRFWPNEFDEGEEGDAAPATIELAPGGDAVEVAHVFKLREGVELFPGECLRVLDETADFEAPFA